MTDQERVTILLKEYDGLRAEVTARTGFGFQIVNFGIVAFIFLMTRVSSPDAVFWVSLVLALIVIGVAAYFDLRDIRRASRRIGEIELDINARAGEDLLIWENLYSPAATGFLVELDPVLEPCSKAGNRLPAQTGEYLSKLTRGPNAFAHVA
jgi:hypothetical protein